MATETDYDRAKEVRDFDDSKIGVKGLVDSGTVNIPRFFVHPPENLTGLQAPPPSTQIPTVDLSGSDSHRRAEIVRQIRDASREFGFFQIVNHGVPLEAMEATICAVKAFNEQPAEVKAAHYGRGMGDGVNFNTNVDLFRSKAANWRDTLQVALAPVAPKWDRVPAVCRRELMDWGRLVTELGETLMGVLSEGLGLETERLKELSLLEGIVEAAHYYPYCPQPDLTLGLKSHTDPSAVAVLLTNDVGSLQVKHGEEWLPVEPIKGALVVNIGDILQMASNDEYKSVEHRVLANPLPKPRVTVALFFNPGKRGPSDEYGPLPELVSSPGKPPIYRNFTFSEFLGKVFGQELGQHLMMYQYPVMAPMEYSSDDRAKAVEEFKESKTGVKGLVDTGMTTIPRLFIHSPDSPRPFGNRYRYPPSARSLIFHDGDDVVPTSIPTIDLSNPVRSQVVERVRDAAAEFGFFRVINHGVPVWMMEDTLSAIKAFHELPAEEKKPYHHRSLSREPGSVGFLANPVRSKAATWRDTLKIITSPGRFDWDRVPVACRAQLSEWDRTTAKLEHQLVELLCEGLGLRRDRLEEFGYCSESRTIFGHYYPYCPQPELTLGAVAHTDPLFLTLLVVQGHADHEALQAKYCGEEWIDVKPLNHASFLVNIGDIFQMMSNGKYKSVEHRVVANSQKDPRISIANFFGPTETGNYRSYGPLPELVSDEKPAEYRNFTMEEFMREFLSNEITSIVDRFKI
ncbi:hypothetical protein H6P81_015186 [Aristolochia fimbriata]|uniref:Fe2OG dioxygenase domain-containing protein n=1 Tax=Aristolochia fimbriata TaxID=158543 RepID=A0AAV7E7M8_ARIFI|nr:hypothetical protein H6P81_015186 [Aristolochia fimbriata]